MSKVRALPRAYYEIAKKGNGEAMYLLGLFLKYGPVNEGGIDPIMATHWIGQAQAHGYGVMENVVFPAYSKKMHEQICSSEEDGEQDESEITLDECMAKVVPELN